MPKILILDDEVRIRELMRKALEREGHEVVSVPSSEQALEIIFKEPFDLFLLDIGLSGESGISVLKKVREYRKNVPIVIYSGVLTSELEQEARIAGANEVFSKDMDILQLVEQIKKIVKSGEKTTQGPAKSGEKKSLLIVDDEEGIRRVLREFFKRKGFDVFEAGSGEEALQLIRSTKVSVVLLDMRMPGMDGLETLRKILEINPKLGVVMATAEQDDEKIKIALELGAYSYVLKPFDFAYLELVVMSRINAKTE
ncbi:MAG TPA: response regulator [Candidatus Margulisiibacteriota bacterium]|nr:response regulator [Candidatus Margulisiibacteriota bacterium]